MRSALKLFPTGQCSATRFKMALSFFATCSGNWISILISLIRRGFALMTLVTSAVVPVMSIFRFLAAIPMMVMMQDASEVAHRSVGEKASPLPSLSTGASVIIYSPDCKCVAAVLTSPK